MEPRGKANPNKAFILIVLLRRTPHAVIVGIIATEEDPNIILIMFYRHN